MHLIILLSLLLTSAPSIFASGSASFGDSYAEKLYSYRDEGDIFYETYSTGKFSLRGRIPLSAPLPATLDPETPVALSLGAWSVEGTLADGNYKPGKRAVKFKVAETGAVISVAWTARVLTWSVTGRTGMTKNGDDLDESPGAAGYAGEETGRISSV